MILKKNDLFNYGKQIILMTLGYNSSDRENNPVVALFVLMTRRRGCRQLKVWEMV